MPSAGVVSLRVNSDGYIFSIALSNRGLLNIDTNQVINISASELCVCVRVRTYVHVRARLHKASHSAQNFFTFSPPYLQGLKSYEVYQQYPHHADELQMISDAITGGSTAALALIMDNDLYVANTGDSRVVLCTCSSRDDLERYR